MSTEVHTGELLPYMDEEEQKIADRIYAAIQDASHGSVRSQQARQSKAGVSDLGFCPERTRRLLDGQQPERTDALLAFLGTAIGDHVEQAVASAIPNVIRQAEVKVPLYVSIDGETVRIELPGHPDLILPDESLMIDVKTDYMLADPEKNGPSEQQRFQRHLYGYGGWIAGLFPNAQTLEEVRVGNAWVDRSGQDKRVHVDIEPFSMEVVDQATKWLEDVVYHQVRGEAAHKKPPRDMCAAVCGFFRDCRLFDTDVEGVLDDPEVVNATAMYVEGIEKAREGERLKKAAKVKLLGLDGVIPVGEERWMLRWTSVPETFVPETVKRGYDKIDLRPIKSR